MIEISYVFDRAEKEIQFTINGEQLSVFYKDDVDLTDIIVKLTALIDKKDVLHYNDSFDASSLEDEKEKIIHFTIQEIIKNFNETINEQITETA